MKGAVTTLINPETQEEKDFAFDFSYWSHDGFEIDDTGYNDTVAGSSHFGAEYASQKTVYDNLGAPMLQNALAGYNCTMFAYGQVRACPGCTPPYLTLTTQHARSMCRVACARCLQ